MSETYVSQLRKLNVVALEQEPSLFPFRFSMQVYGITLDQKCYRVKSGCKLARKGRYSCQANVKTSRFLESIQEMGCKCFTENGSNVAHHLIHHWICLFIYFQSNVNFYPLHFSWFSVFHFQNAGVEWEKVLLPLDGHSNPQMQCSRCQLIEVTSREAKPP